MGSCSHTLASFCLNATLHKRAGSWARRTGGKIEIQQMFGTFRSYKNMPACSKVRIATHTAFAHGTSDVEDGYGRTSGTVAQSSTLRHLGISGRHVLVSRFKVRIREVERVKPCSRRRNPGYFSAPRSLITPKQTASSALSAVNNWQSVRWYGRTATLTAVVCQMQMDKGLAG